MPAEKPMHEDPVIRRLAAARPTVAEEDLSPRDPRALAIAERVLAGPSADPPPRPGRRERRRRPTWALPRLGLALAPLAMAAAAAVLFFAGVFRGPDDSGTQSAAASVIRATRNALAPSSGSIFVEDETYIAGPSVHGRPWTLHEVLQTPAGPGPQSQLSSAPPVQFGGRENPVGGASVIGGTEEIYLPSTNTIYAQSIWGPYLHPGPRPGTYLYRYASGAPAYTTHPILITARQRRALLSGRAVLRITGRTIHGKVYLSGLKVLPPLRAPAENAQTIASELANSSLHLVGCTRVDGRAAIELAAHTTDGTAPELHLYFDPRTHLPFEEVENVGTRRQTTIRLQLRKLPITPANERLLNLRALHPTARVVRGEKSYHRANRHGIQVFAQ